MKALGAHKLIRYSVFLMVLMVANILFSLCFVFPAHAQIAPFMNTPYYGQKNITSRFDHELPNYGVDDTLVGFDGVRRGPPASVTNCSNGINGSCYNGHDGYDFSIYYEPVIAAAAGTVTQAQWNVLNVRQGPSALFGLYIEIDHGNGYRTRYGHLSTLAVSVGQAVQAGEIIGTTGNTGNSGAAHLHFGVLSLVNGNWRAVDPFGWTGSSADPWQTNINGATSYCLWKDGEWANYCGGLSRPIPAPVNGGETIVDDTTNNSGGFSKGNGGSSFVTPCTGDCLSWSSAAVGYNNHIYYTSADRVNNIADQWAKWTPPGIPTGGAIYEIFVHVPNTNATSWQAPFVVSYRDNQGNAATTTTTVDQYGLSNQWVSIGSYRMASGDYVYTHDATGEPINGHCNPGYCLLAADAVKFVRRGVVYVSDVRNVNGWTPSLVIRNNGSGQVTPLVKFYRIDGAPVCASLGIPTLNAHAFATLSCNDTSVSHAVVEGSQDLAVLLENKNAASVTNYNGISAVDPFGNGASTLLYVPAVKNDFAGRTGALYLLNIGASSTTVNITMRAYDNGGASVACSGVTLNANAQTIYAPAACGLANNKFYGVQINSTQPLAVVSVERNTTGTNAYTASSNAVTSGATTIYAPLIKSAYFGNNTGLAVQNVGSSNTDISVLYYDRDSGSVWSTTYTGLAPNSSHAFYVPNTVPAGVVGSAKIDASGPVAITVYENKPAQNWYMQYNGVLNGAKVVYLPRIYKNVGTNLQRTGVQVQNVGSSNANIRIRYYQSNGATNTFWDTLAGPIAANRAATFYTPDNSGLSDGFQGTAIVFADEPVVVQVNVVSNDTNDAAMIYNGVNR